MSDQDKAQDQQEPEPPVGFIVLHDKGNPSWISLGNIVAFYRSDAGQPAIITEYGENPVDESPAEIAAKISAAQERAIEWEMRTQDRIFYELAAEQEAAEAEMFDP